MNTGELHPKLVKCINEMMSDMTLLLYYYGEFCQFVVFKETDHIPRCAVTISSGGMIFYWNRNFLDITPQKHVNFILVHEIFHFILDHPKRIRKGGYDIKLSNIATDMIINTAIKSDFIDDVKSTTKYFIEVPTEKQFSMETLKVEDKIWVLMVPPEYDGNHIFEEIYEWLKEEKKKFDEWKEGDSWLDDPQDGKEKSEQGDGKPNPGNGKPDKKDGKGKPSDKDDKGKSNDVSGENDTNDNKNKKDDQNRGKPSKDKGDKCPVSDYLKDIFDGCDDGVEDWLDSHLPNEVPDEIRKSIIEDVKNSLRQRGHEKGKVKRTLEKLVKSKKDYLREIKTNISSIKGFFKVKTITKRNRRGIPGIKGKRKEGFGLVVILDVSGSMGGYFQRALSYIFQNNITIYLIQCDYVVQKTGTRSYTTIRNKKDFKKFEIQGLGGTRLQPALDLQHSTKELKFLNTLILTDGDTDSLDVSRQRKVLILSVKKRCPIKAGNPRQILVEDDIAKDDW